MKAQTEVTRNGIALSLKKHGICVKYLYPIELPYKGLWLLYTGLVCHNLCTDKPIR